MLDFNFTSFTGGEVSGGEIADSANQFPMMDQLKVVLVRQADQLNRTDWEKLLPYLQNPVKTTVLIFTDGREKPSYDGRSKWGKILPQYTVLCKKPYDNQIPNWLQHRAKQHSIELTPDSAYLIFEKIGSDLTQLDNALQRLSLFLGGQGKVSSQLVEEVLPEIRESDIFDLLKYIGEKKLEPALKELKRLLERGQSPLGITALLAHNIRQLISARELYDAGDKSLSKFPFPAHFSKFIRKKRAQELKNQLSHFTLSELVRALILIEETEKNLKFNNVLSANLILDQLIFALILPSENYT